MFTASDRTGAPEVAIVNETLAKRAWPGEDPIGRTLLYDDGGTGGRPLQVVGVARDAKYRSIGEEPRSFIYVPMAQHYFPEFWVMIRATGRTLLPAVRDLVHQIDPNLPVVQMATLSDATALGLMPHRLAAWIAGCASTIGLLLSALGIYGITSYSVNQRTREIGIRIALRANRHRVVGLVVRQGMMLAGTGGVLGLVFAGFATQLLSGLLYGVQPIDPASFLGGAGLLGMLAAAASAFPARRAVLLNPVEALRVE